MSTEFKPAGMTYSALQRFAELVDMAMDADMVDPRQRINLIGAHAYDYANPAALDNMRAGIVQAQNVDRQFITDPRNGFQRVVF